MRYALPPLFHPVLRLNISSYSWSIRKLIVLWGTGLSAALLSLSLVVAYMIATNSLNSAYSRNAQLRAKAQASEINRVLFDARQELQFIAGGSLAKEEVYNHLLRRTVEGSRQYREIAFQGNTVDERFVFVSNGDGVASVPIEQTIAETSGIFPINDQIHEKSPGYVHIGEPVEVLYPAVSFQGVVRAVAMRVIRLTMPVFSGGGSYRGKLTISIDLDMLRTILSLHASEDSPVFLFPQDKETKKSFFFDSSGWLLFQSEKEWNNLQELNIDDLRLGLRGDLGRPGFKTAFRPDSDNVHFWHIVSEVQNQQSGQVLVDRYFSEIKGGNRQLYLSYEPIVFRESQDSAKVIGGLGCLDTSFVFLASTQQVAWTLVIAFAVSCTLVFFAMNYLSFRIRAPIETMARAIETRVSGDDTSPLDTPFVFSEINQFQKSINILLVQLQVARNDYILRAGRFESDWLAQPINLEKEIEESTDLDRRLLEAPLHGIVGGGPAIANLRQQIHKASRVLADVLIIGETGTGKELAAEAIHAVSYRAQGPFISINCGALDENLLMDALFGHVKGAFSEAHADRQGAFVAASGGTLHLDEIANASPKVQQALLRALSVRRIRPLGSDKDIAFDARIVAATNIDLLQLALSGKFREDLYYRLAVITIAMPPLRHRREDIPVLVKHFLEEYCLSVNKSSMSISRGALEKLVGYDWPGNIRELKNCLTRSLAFAEGDILASAHILFDKRPSEEIYSGAAEVKAEGAAIAGGEGGARRGEEGEGGGSRKEQEADLVLNERQKKMWSLIVRQGGITRIEYQNGLEGAMSVRTAQYDLQDLVAKGLLAKSGKGPSLRYVVKTNGQNGGGI
jgi:two-component system, NtrC family, response regulator HydG